MKKKYIPLLLLLLYSLSHLAPAIAGDEPSMIIDLKEGINYIDFNNDGRKDMVVKAWRENNNAHGYYMYVFLINNPDAELKRKEMERHIKEVGPDNYLDWERRNTLATGQVIEWLIVVFEDEKGDHEDSFHTHQGADCVLEDIYLLKNKDDKFKVIIAKRPFKESFYEKQRVTFYLYEFLKNEEGLMGYPPFRFAYKDKMITRKSYCDVNEAFEKEYELLLKPLKKLPIYPTKEK